MDRIVAVLATCLIGLVALAWASWPQAIAAEARAESCRTARERYAIAGESSLEALAGVYERCIPVGYPGIP